MLKDKSYGLKSLGFAVGILVAAFFVGREIQELTLARVVEPTKEQVAAEKWVNPRSKTRDNTHYDREVLSQAVYNSMRPKLDYVGFGSSLESINRARVKLKCVEDWVASLQEGEVKDAYLSWINYLRNDYNNKEEELNKPKPIEDEWEVKHKELSRKAAALDIARVPSQVCTPKETK